MLRLFTSDANIVAPEIEPVFIYLLIRVASSFVSSLGDAFCLQRENTKMISLIYLFIHHRTHPWIRIVFIIEQ